MLTDCFGGRTGGKRKIEQLYEKYNRLMYSIAYKSLRNSYDAVGYGGIFVMGEGDQEHRQDRRGRCTGNQGVSRGGRETYDHRYVSQKKEENE